jgi:polysaccharide deacetylase family protein (PEP-CTERM system associated)
MTRLVKPNENAAQILNAFTVDVEDYFQVTAFESQVSRNDWEQIPSRVVESTQRLLRLLNRYHVKATFFVLGWTAEKFPTLVEQISAAGHELACHSYWHRLIYRQTPEEFREDLQRAKRAIEHAGGQTIVAYRAPSFSVTRRSLWALEILVEEGFEIDSSIFPTVHDRYGMPNCDLRLHMVETPAGSLWEFPLAIQRVGRMSVPISGGGYFRLFPFHFSRLCLENVNRRKRPFAFYIHPWEVDPQQPRIDGASRLSRFRHYVNLQQTEQKLERLLKAFCFGTISEVVAKHRAAASELLPVPAQAAFASVEV